MFKRSTITAACFFALFASSSSPGNAQLSWQSHAYQATYDVSLNGSHSTYKYASDGNGRGRLDVYRSNGRHDISIIDMHNHSVTFFAGDNPQPMSMPVTDEQLLNMGMQTESLISDRHQLGVRVIDGHPCHGETYTLGGLQTEVWHGDDISGCRVLSKTASPFGETISQLRSYSGQGPAPGMLEHP